MTDTASVIEVMLLRWSDNQNGRTVTFQLPDDGGDHPFKGLKCGPANGERLAISVARISDDETQQEVTTQPRPPDETPSKTGGAQRNTAPQRAGILCNDMVFRAFLNEMYAAGCSNSDEAAEFIRDYCNVESRADLTRGNPHWMELLGNFEAWKIEVSVVP